MPDPTKLVTEHLQAELAKLPAAGRYWVAYSGGMDSHCLLHACAALAHSLPGRLCAVHVDHGLSGASGRWASHCEAVCAALGVEFRLFIVNARAPGGESPEAWARKCRYRALAALLGDDEVLLTAHHMDDQAETVLLQLLRGAGPHGLAAMGGLRRFAKGWLARPLLAVGRVQLRDYARACGLHWVEDQSNMDLRFERNVLRHEIMPGLRKHWPHAANALSRAASWQASAAVLLDEVAAEGLNACYRTETASLSVGAMNELEAAKRPYVVRAWLRRRGLPAPSARHVQRILADLLHPLVKGSPCVNWAGVQVRRYRDDLYALPDIARPLPGKPVVWQPPAPLRFGPSELRAADTVGSGLSRRRCAGAAVTVRFRRGGERCRPAGRAHGQSLKKLLQETGIPPWQRPSIPLIYVGDELAAVGDLWVCAGFEAGEGERGWTICWIDAAGTDTGDGAAERNR